MDKSLLTAGVNDCEAAPLTVEGGRLRPLGGEITGLLSLDEPVLHNTAEILQANPLLVKTAAQPWAYAVAFAARPAAFDDNQWRGDIVVELDLEVEDGEVYAGALSDDLAEFLGSETNVTAGAGRARVRLLVSDADRFSWLMIRNGSTGGPAVFRLYALGSYEAGKPPGDLREVRSPEFPNLLDAANPVSPLIVSRPASGGEPEGAGLDEYLRVLRKKWSEVPAGISGRRRTTDLLDLDEDHLKAQWLAMHEETTTGEGFSVRGWYQTLYRDVLARRKVLDVGSGLGLDAVAFARSGARMTSVDIVETNQQVIRKLCRIFALDDVRFLLMDSLASLKGLSGDFDFIWCQGSMINAPFEYMKVESRELLRRLPVGGRWVELAYPKERWQREGALPFGRWGEKTDGPGTPWMEWYDLEKWRARMYPAEFDVVLQFNFHNDDFCWFDMIRTR